MAFEDFLSGFARAQQLESKEALLTSHAEQYRFQIGSRDRAKAFISNLEARLGYTFAGKKVLDIGCAYGSFSIELAHAGAVVTGIDVSRKWLRLAALNAQGEVDVRFLRQDASARTALQELGDEQYDLIVLNDVLEHIYDTAGLLHNCKSLLADDGVVYFKVPNGLSTDHVLSEGHKKVFGVSLLPPDYWSPSVKAPFSIYYRRLEFFEALFERFGFAFDIWITNMGHDAGSIRSAIRRDVSRIQKALDTGSSSERRAVIDEAVLRYFAEVEVDLSEMDALELHRKYRVNFWEGVLWKAPGREHRGQYTIINRRRWGLGGLARVFRSAMVALVRRR